MTAAPVDSIPTDPDSQQLTPGKALCLSGGGYRAMIFHVGVLWRLYESDLLGSIDRISSVSGGSITAAVLALAWPQLTADSNRSRATFEASLVQPIRSLAGTTIDADAIVFGFVLPGRISARVVDTYDQILFHGKTLQDLPDAPRFVFNATNVQSGALWRFMKPYMADYRVGIIDRPTIALAQAVAASSAFPPVLSPVEMKLDPKSFRPNSGLDLQYEPFTSRVFLSDGGVYDNLGLETAWKRYDTVLVSDGGAKMKAEEEPKSDWARHAYRVLSLIDNQVRALRKRQLIGSFQAPPGDKNHRKGAYWGIGTGIADYGLADVLPCPADRTAELASIPTRLKRVDETMQERLINWGYAVCDAAVRAHVKPDLAPLAAFPYPASGV